MEKEKQPNGRRNEKLRPLKVNVVYGRASLAECMEHVIRAKYHLR